MLNNIIRSGRNNEVAKLCAALNFNKTSKRSALQRTEVEQRGAIFQDATWDAFSLPRAREKNSRNITVKGNIFHSVRFQHAGYSRFIVSHREEVLAYSPGERDKGAVLLETKIERAEERKERTMK